MRILFYIFILIPIIAIGQNINIQDNFSNLKNSPHISLKLLHNIESQGGIHLIYIQLYDSIPVYDSQVKVNLNKEGNIKSIFASPTPTLPKGEGEPTPGKPVTSTNNFPDESKVSAYLNNIRLLKSSKTERIYFFNEGLLIPAAKMEISEGDHSYYEVIIDSGGKVLYQKDLNRYFLKFVQDSIVAASVFMPDPLTTAGVIYGSLYVDSNDSDVPELNAERVSVNITVDFTNDTFRLISPYIKIMELSSPATPETYSVSPSFNYTRFQQEFEDVNVYYHINFFQQYIQSLGFTNLANYQVGADAHALNGDDQSIFSGGDILFGEGGVDDAEDADVIIHEYGHAILETAAPGTWSGFERQALEEGFGDYLATSYSRYLNPFNWQNMFSWDGHNPFWNGRTAASTKLYPTDLGSDIHLAGEIWSSALMQIWGDIGRTTTDRILLQSLYSYAAGMTMTDAANLFLQSDSLLNGGANYCMIYQRFEDRGILPPIPFLCTYISSSSDITCNGICDGIAIVNTKGGTSPFSYLWDDSLLQTTDTATGLCAGPYMVMVIDFVGDTAYVTVTINEQDVLTGITATTNEQCSICNNGTVTIIPNGGTPPYTYLWNDPLAQTGSTATSLDTGVYSVTVTDVNGCTYIVTDTVGTDSVTIFSVFITLSKDANCFGECNGRAVATAYAGAGNYTYQWDDTLLQTTDTATGLCPGIYIVNASDTTGATAKDTIIIGEPNPLIGVVSTTPDSGNSNGMAIITASGGTHPYSYQWDDSMGQTNDTAVGLSAGAYSVSVTDANGCVFNGSDVVGFYNSIAKIYTDNSILIKLFPNPSGGKFQLAIIPEYLGAKGELKIYNVLGEKVYYSTMEQLSNGTIDISNQPYGIYILSIQTPFEIINLKLIKVQ